MPARTGPAAALFGKVYQENVVGALAKHTEAAELATKKVEAVKMALRRATADASQRGTQAPYNQNKRQAWLERMKGSRKMPKGDIKGSETKGADSKTWKGKGGKKH